MNSNIVSQLRTDIEGLMQGWIAAEKNGEKYPVPFELAWGLAGYSRKDNAKRRLINKKSRLVENRDYLLRSEERLIGGRPGDLIQLTCDAFKAFCLLAETDEGDDIRAYFIEAEKRWELVKQVAPKVSEEVEILAMKIELAKIETQRAVLEDKSLSFRHWIITTQPKPTADRVLGVTVVHEIEQRDRIVKDNNIINGGSTINKTDICKLFGITTRSGAADFKTLNRKLKEFDLPESAWEETDVIQTNRELKREYLPQLERSLYTAAQRQLWIGENSNPD